jgi:hypothetical protein
MNRAACVIGWLVIAVVAREVGIVCYTAARNRLNRLGHADSHSTNFAIP